MKRKLAVFLAAALCVTSLGWSTVMADELPAEQPEPGASLTAPAIPVKPAESPDTETEAAEEIVQTMPQEEIPAVLPGLEETEILGADAELTIGPGGYLEKNDFENAASAADCAPFTYKDATITTHESPDTNRAMTLTGGGSSVSAVATFEPTYILDGAANAGGHEGVDCKTVTEFDIKFDNLVKTGANFEVQMMWIGSADNTLIQRYQFNGAAQQFMYFNSGFKPIDASVAGRPEAPSVEETAVRDNQWYRLRIVMNATQPNEPARSLHTVDVYFNGVQIIKNQKIISTTQTKTAAYDKLILTGLNGITVDSQDPSVSYKAGCSIDNFSIYKRNVNTPEMLADKGALIRQIRIGAEKYASAVPGSSEDEYDPVKYEDMGRALDEAMKVYKISETQDEIDTAAKTLEPIVQAFKPNGRLIQVEALRYYNPDAVVDGSHPKMELESLEETDKLSVEAQLYASDKGPDASSVAVTSVLYHKDSQFPNGRPVQARSSGVLDMEKGRTRQTAVELDLTPYPDRKNLYVKTMVWNDFQTPSEWLKPAATAFLDGELSYGAPDEFGGDLQVKQEVAAKDDMKISVMVKAEPGEEVSLSVPAAGLKSEDVAGVTTETFAQKMFYVGQMTAEADGFAKFELNLTGKSDQYELILCKNNNGEIIKQPVTLHSGAEIQSILDAVYAAGTDGTAVKELLTAHQDVLGITTPLYQLTQAKAFDFDEVATAVTSKQYQQTGLPGFQADFYRALAVAAANQLTDPLEISGLLKPGNSISAADALGLTTQIGEAAKRYMAYLAFSTDRDQRFAELLIKGRPYTLKTLQDGLNEAVLLTQVNKAVNWDTISVALAESPDLIVKTRYSGLEDNQKGKVCQELYRHKNVNTMEELVRAINDAIQTVENGSGNGGSGGSSGGSGGSTGGGSRGPSAGGFSGTTTGEPNPLEQPSPMERLKSNFTDIDSVPWAAEAIQVLSARGVINGIDATLFAPNDTVKREEFVKMAVLTFGLLDPDASAAFEDVRPEDWFYPYVASGASLGLVKGISETAFGSGQDLSRQDLATLVYRFGSTANVAFVEDGEYIPFDDDDQISKCARTAVELLTRSGIINGVGGNQFQPTQSCTRAEAAKMLYEVSRLVVAQ